MVKQSASRSFRRSASAPGEARTFLDTTITAWDRPGPHPDAQLVVSELVANAARHVAKGEIEVSFELLDNHLRIAVTDLAPLLLPTKNEPHGDGGYGLNIVHTLTYQWGCDAAHDTKTVWAEIDLAPIT